MIIIRISLNITCYLSAKILFSLIRLCTSQKYRNLEIKLRMNVQTVPFLSISEISSYCCPTNISKRYVLGTFYCDYDVSWRCVLFIQEVRADNINIVTHLHTSERMTSYNKSLPRIFCQLYRSVTIAIAFAVVIPQSFSSSSFSSSSSSSSSS